MQPGSATADTRRIARRDELSSDAWPVVTHLADLRLVVTRFDERSEQDVVELVHEALISSWKLLHDWMIADRKFRLWQEELRVLMRSWLTGRSHADGLLHGLMLAEAKRWIAERKADLSHDECEYIITSIDSQSKIEAQARRSRTARFVAVVAVAVTCLLLASAAWIQGRIATSRELTARSLSLISSDPDESVQLALNAVRMRESSETQNALRRSLMGNRLKLLWLDSRLQQPKPFAGEFDGANGAVLSRDGSMVAIALGTYIVICDARSGKQLGSWRNATSGSDYVTSVDFSSDGNRIVTAHWDNSARIWDVKSHALLSTLSGHSDRLNRATFSPDGKKVPTASRDNTARVWDLETGRSKSLPHGSWVYDAAYSPDGKLIATASFDQTARIWNADTGALIRTLKGHKDFVYSSRFNPDGSQLITASRDGTARIWNVGTGVTVSELRGHANEVLFAEFNNDGTLAVSASADNTARVWSVPDADLVYELRGHAGRVYTARVLEYHRDAMSRLDQLRTAKTELPSASGTDGISELPRKGSIVVN